MTSREYFVNVLNAHISEEMDATSTKMIERLDAKNAKRKSTDTKDKREARARRESVLTFLRDHADHIYTRDEIATEVGITAGQVSAACKVLVTEGIVAKSEVKADGSRKMAYTLT